MDCIPIFLRGSWFDLFEQHVSHVQRCLQIPISVNVDNDKQKTFIAVKEVKQNNRLSPIRMESTTNYYSPMYGIANSPPTINLTSDSISASSADLLKQYDTIDILPLTLVQARAWQQALKPFGFEGHLYQHSENWYESGIENLEHYWQRRPSKLKNTIKRKQDLMYKTGGFSSKIFSCGAEPALLQALIDYHLVYQQSWKANEPSPAFIDAISYYAWQQNELRLGVMYHQDKPIAAQIWFVCGTTAYIYKLSYVSDFKKFSPGTALMAELLKHVIDVDNVNTIDFLTGNDEYKKEWMSESRCLYGLQLCNTKTLFGLSDHLKSLCLSTSKKWLSVKTNN